MNYQTLTIEKEEGIAIVTINRPKYLNAINSMVLKELGLAFKEFSESKEIKAVIITGSGEKAFVAGADIAEMKDMTSDEAQKFALLGNQTFNLIENLSKPVLAAINGYALGGGNELALAADIRLAADNARFGQPEVGLGIIPGFGGTQRLAKIIGVGKAKELLLTGEIIDAEEATRIGLVNKVVPLDKLMDEARKLARKISSNAPLALKYCKEAVNFGLGESIDKGLAFESNSFALCFSTEDQKSGMEAFLTKKKAEFKGR